MKNIDLFHEYAYAGPRDRNEVNSVFYSNDTCYSYGYHFPMAIKVRNKNGAVSFVLWNNSTYSKTTSKQQSQLAGALYQDLLTIETMDTNWPDVVRNPKHYKRDLKKLMSAEFEEQERLILLEALKMTNAGKDWSINHYANSIENRINMVRRLSEDFRVKSLLSPVLKRAIKDGTAENVCEWAAPAMENRKAKIERAKRKAEKLAKRKEAQKVQDWKEFKIRGNIYTNSGLSYLRFDKETEMIETSQGIKIELSEALRLLRLIELKKAVGEKVKSQYQEYTITKCNGILVSGCHRIEKEEINEIAKILKDGK